MRTHVLRIDLDKPMVLTERLRIEGGTVSGLMVRSRLVSQVTLVGARPFQARERTMALQSFE